MASLRAAFVALCCCAAAASDLPYRPLLRLLNQSDGPVISEADTRRLAGFGFEGGRTVKDEHGHYWLFTAEFQGWPVNANMRIAIWHAERAFGPWTRHSTIAASQGDGESLETWGRTCRTDNFEASPWAPFPLFSEDEDRWHVLWISYACDLSWVVRVGVGNIRGAVSQTPGREGIAGPYEDYGIIIGPNATGSATRWGDLGECAACRAGGTPPVYCNSRPCMYANGITGAAIGIGPWSMPPGSPTKFAAFVGLDHDYAGANSPRGPWTIYSAAQMGEIMITKMSTRSSPYSENPVVSEITQPDGQKGFISVFDTVDPTGGWAWEDGRWQPAGRGEWYGFGISYSGAPRGQYWSDGEDVRVEGGVRTPMGLMEEADGTLTMLFTRRHADCANQVLPFGGRGDGANDKTMCALMYAASFEIEWVQDRFEVV